MPFTSIFTSAIPQISKGRLLAPRTCWTGRRTWVSCDLTLPNSSLLMSVYSSCGVDQGFNLLTVTRQNTKRALSVVTLETRSTWRELKLGSVSWEAVSHEARVDPPWIRFPWAVPAIITYLSTVQALSPSATRVCSCFAHGSTTRRPTRCSVEGIMLLPRRGTCVPEPAVLTAAVALFAFAPLAATTMACRVLFTTKRASRRKAWHTVSSEVVRMVRLPANRSPRDCTAFTNTSPIFSFRDFSPRPAKVRLAGMT